MSDSSKTALESREALAAVNDYLFAESLSELDPDTDLLIKGEADRETERLIFIASESIAPRAVRTALTSAFGNMYAEGYASRRLVQRERSSVISHHQRHLSFYRRYSDRRFYKGTEFCDLIEALAQHRTAEAFATAAVPADDIFVNVQALSGAAANNAVYTALCKPGDTVMGLSLPHGGHLTHGAPWNRTGQLYHSVPYELDLTTGKIDYDALEALALEHQPRLLIAGASAYPWHIDWARLRAIADQVPGCHLLADISHPSGLVVAGFFPNPIEHAHVVTSTTHKTLCGPRGAIIMTREPAVARAVDTAVFPGEQGGPHLNSIAAIAVAMRITKGERFKALQQQILDNCQALCDGFKSRGLPVAYGGTESHLCLIDINGIKPASGVKLNGQLASNIMDLCGIVTNKNTIAGDVSAADSSALRFGTTFMTQRGATPADMDQVADIVHRLLSGADTFRIVTKGGWRGRARVPLETLETARAEVAAMARRLPGESLAPAPHPHLRAPQREVQATPLAETGLPTTEVAGRTTTRAKEPKAAEAALETGLVVADASAAGWIRLTGERARAQLEGCSTANLSDLEPGQGRAALLLRVDGNAGDGGKLLDDVWIFKESREAYAREMRESWLVRTTPEQRLEVLAWFRALSDGYVRFTADGDDIARKIEGPLVVEDLGATLPHEADLFAVALLGPLAESVVAESDLGGIEAGQLKTGSIEGVAVTAVRMDRAAGQPWIELLADPSVITGLGGKLMAREGAVAGGVDTLKAARERAMRPAPGSSVADAVQAAAGNIDLTKPWFIGQAAAVEVLGAPKAAGSAFSFDPESVEQGRATALNAWHREHGGKMVPFAGWDMPVLYNETAFGGRDAVKLGIFEEHRAVREGAGLFDVAHMGSIAVTGPHAERFLDLVTTNYVGKLRPNTSHYTYVLGTDGIPLDDILIYRRGPEDFLLVVNASNHEKVMAWFNAVNTGAAILDTERPWITVEHPTDIEDLKQASAGDRRIVDLALQGPVSKQVIQSLASPADARAISLLKGFQLTPAKLGGIDLIVSRTGYTGEPWGFELLVHPGAAVDLWTKILENGWDLGVRPAGLGSRDSTRTEAGFPLYGHELEGPDRLTPFHAGYGAFVKWHKTFFVGRDPLRALEEQRTTELVRFVIPEPDKKIDVDDVVTDRRGRHLGKVTSACTVDGEQIGLALVDKKFTAVGTKIAVLPKRVIDKPGKKFPVGELGVVASRFLRKKRK